MIDSADVKALKDHVLGPRYELSLAFVSSRVSRELNRLYRHKDKPANILSFPLTDTDGEILMVEALITQEAEKLGWKPTDYTIFLFIHGLLHLKGYAHGSKMEHEEQVLAKFFTQHVQKHHRRIRHRDSNYKVGGLRVGRRT
ncbi:MAG: rRNA maturation RNase YbeY [Patescibacteria group bacterium]|nr:rRNA maturation RNase YbeY [Patescibacteria group bacterium]